MLSNIRAFRYIYLGIVLLFVFTCWQLKRNGSNLLYDSLTKDRPKYRPGWYSMSKEKFVAAAVESGLDDSFDYTPIKTLCDAQIWDPSVVFTCHGIIGGIGNIRQELLHCMRYAIDAGAAIILPTLNIRSEDELSDLTNGTAPLSYLFDETRFQSRSRIACPQMKIYENMEKLKMVGPVVETNMTDVSKIRHWPFFPFYSIRTLIQRLKARAPPGHISLIPFERVWRNFPICHDPTPFADNFGTLLPLREDVHRLAATALYKLLSDFHRPFLPSATTPIPVARTFLGIHLRTASDILPYWLNYTDQVSYYLSHIRSSDYLTSIPVIYVASGNKTSIQSFASEIQELSCPSPVVTKEDLLFGNDLSELQSLTWDQQALVDLLILERSSFFMGMADSSFAWTVANRRRRYSKGGTCRFPSGFWKSKLWGTAFDDEYSDLMGNHGYGWEDKMWP